MTIRTWDVTPITAWLPREARSSITSQTIVALLKTYYPTTKKYGHIPCLPQHSLVSKRTSLRRKQSKWLGSPTIFLRGTPADKRDLRRHHLIIPSRPWPRGCSA